MDNLKVGMELLRVAKIVSAAWEDMGPTSKNPKKRVWRDSETGEVRWQISTPRTESKPKDLNKPVTSPIVKPNVTQTQEPNYNVSDAPKNGTTPLNEKKENIEVPNGVIEKTDQPAVKPMAGDGYNRDISIPINPSKVQSPLNGQNIDIPDDIWNSHAELSVKAKKMALGMLAADPMLSEFSSEEQARIKNIANKSIEELTKEMIASKQFRANLDLQKDGQNVGIKKV